jgi:hypothetical protein
MAEPHPRLLIHIGFPKAGTHFLHHWFRSHPEVDLVTGRFIEPGAVEALRARLAGPAAGGGERLTVVSDESLAAAVPDLEGRLYREEVEPVRFEEIEAACRRLAAAFPEAGVLVLTRGFRAMLVSGFSQSVKAGGSLPFFAQRSQALNARGVSGAFLNYGFVVQTYRTHFGGPVTVLPYELLDDDPAAFVSRLSRSLGIAPLRHSDRRLNPALGPVELAWYPRLSALVKRAPMPASLRSRLFEAYRARIGSHRLRPLIAAFQTLRPLAPVSADSVPPEALDHFRGHADLLAELEPYPAYREPYLLPPASN